MKILRRTTFILILSTLISGVSGACLKFTPAELDGKSLTGFWLAEALGCYVNLPICYKKPNDYNGDNISDLVVSAPIANGNVGYVSFYFGNAGFDISGGANVIINGAVANDFLGVELSGADLNGDGLADLIVSISQGGGTNIGQVFIFLGRKVWPTPLTTANADHSITGIANEGFGNAINRIGDINQDGFDDFAVGSSTISSNNNTAWVFFGGVGLFSKTSSTQADVIITHASARMGLGLGGAGDVNGDGADDYLVGAPGAAAGGTNRGEVYLFYGGKSLKTGVLSFTDADVTIQGTTDSDTIGYNAVGVGDLNSDGFDDFMISGQASGANGQAFLFLGSASLTGSMTYTSANAIFQGDATFQHLGYSVQGLSDLDGDGNKEIMIGCSNEDATNGQYSLLFNYSSVISGNIAAAAAYVQFRGQTSTDDFGYHFVSPGDLSNDGIPDLITGAPAYNAGTNQGAVYYFQGGLTYSSIINSNTANSIALGGVAGDAFAFSLTPGYSP